MVDPLFVNARSGKDLDEQIVTIHKTKFTFIERDRRPAGYKDISNLYEISLEPSK